MLEAFARRGGVAAARAARAAAEEPEAHVGGEQLDHRLGVGLGLEHLPPELGMILAFVLVALPHLLVARQRAEHLIKRHGETAVSARINTHFNHPRFLKQV